jgi:hypothetical protein
MQYRTVSNLLVVGFEFLGFPNVSDAFGHALFQFVDLCELIS